MNIRVWQTTQIYQGWFFADIYVEPKFKSPPEANLLVWQPVSINACHNARYISEPNFNLLSEKACGMENSSRVGDQVLFGLNSVYQTGSNGKSCLSQKSFPWEQVLGYLR